MKNENISWDEHFIELAEQNGLKSDDPSTKVGACIVRDNKVIGNGYNCFPKGCTSDEFPWGREGSYADTKYPYVVHAEANAIVTAKESLEGATIYVTLFPCNECTKLIIQSGIIEVVYVSDKYAKTDSVIASKRMLTSSGIKTRQISIKK